MAKLLFITAVTIFGTACAFKSGAPATDEVCKTMTPDHMAQIQPLKTFPYKVTVDKPSIKPGEILTITIAGNSKTPILGFFVQARVDHTPIGQFEEGDDVQTRDCLTGSKNAATHKNAEKKEIVTIKWKAPRNLQEDVTLWTTVVQRGDIYWVGHKTESIRVTG